MSGWETRPSQETWLLFLALPLFSCVTLGKSLVFSLLLFPQSRMGRRQPFEVGLPEHEASSKHGRGTALRQPQSQHRGHGKGNNNNYTLPNIIMMISERKEEGFIWSLCDRFEHLNAPGS